MSKIWSWIAFLFNIPWTIIGLFAVVFSIPKNFRVSKDPLALIFYVKSLWWYAWIPAKKGIRAMAVGHVVQMSVGADDRDLKHELIHIKQYIREPLIHPLLYFIEQVLHGGYQENGTGNKYEIEAYKKSGSRFFS